MRLLEQFGEDLVAKASYMDPVIGREKEIDTVINILCRKNKNSPALIGEPGVGKTAIAEGLAIRMSKGDVPLQLKDKKLYSLNMSHMVAGTKYRGEFEERMRDFLSEIKRDGSVILFIDELHTIVGAGAAEGAIDASNILKPILGRGEIQVLGATTLDEYRKFIEKDPALERRFRPVLVEEPSFEETMNILNGLRRGLERHHKIQISDGAMTAAIRMSIRYLPDLYLPDKAIDVIDEAAAHVVMENDHKIADSLSALSNRLNKAVQDGQYEKAAKLRDQMTKKAKSQEDSHISHTVTEDDIAWAISARTGIPVTKLTTDEKKNLLNLEEALSHKVMGQTEAIKTVADAIRRGSVGVQDENRPISCMMFTGPTGVGKTELCRALAEEVFGSQNAMIRLDMSEYMEKHSVARLIGAPPGYVGHEDGGKLTEAVRRKPYSLILMDEIEKAHPDVANILLQIMEEGELTDSQGKRVNFKNTIVVLTSNIGATTKSGFGFAPAGKDNEMQTALQSFFRPEFLGRLDKIVRFEALTDEVMEEIASKYLSALHHRMRNLGIDLMIPSGLVQYVTANCKAKDGARQLRHQIQELVEGPLAMFMLHSEITPKSIQCILDQDQLRFM